MLTIEPMDVAVAVIALMSVYAVWQFAKLAVLLVQDWRNERRNSTRVAAVRLRK